jgi:hypothetical protein
MLHLRPVKLLVDPSYADELRDHLLRNAGVTDVCEEDNPGTLTVTLDETLPPEAARLELDVFLNIWRATRPDAPVEIIEA